LTVTFIADVTTILLHKLPIDIILSISPVYMK